MQQAIHIGILIFIVLVGVGFAIIDTFGRIDYIKQYAPWLAPVLERRGGFSTLLLAAILLSIGNLYEVMDHEIPEVESPKFTISAPPAPVIQEPPKKVPIIGAVDRLGPIDRYLDAEQKDHLYQELKMIAGQRGVTKEYLTVTIVPVHRFDRESSRLAF